MNIFELKETAKNIYLNTLPKQYRTARDRINVQEKVLFLRYVFFHFFLPPQDHFLL